MAPRVKRHDLRRVRPGRLERDVYRGLGLAVVRFVRGVEGAHGDGEGAVDAVAPRVRAKGVALLDGAGEAGADDGAAVGWVRGSPFKRVRRDTVLIRISYR